MDKMSFEEFKEQEEYCEKNNVPEGCGCEGCPGENSVCADNIRNIMGKLGIPNYDKIKPKYSNIKELKYVHSKEEVTVSTYEGCKYVYKGVSFVEWIKLKEAPSPGSHLHRYFKNVYSYRRIE